MSLPKPPVIEEHHNFKPVNDYIEHLLDRQRDLLSYRKFNRLKLLLIGISSIFIGMGLSYLLYSWGVYLQKIESPIEVISNIPVPDSTTRTTEGTVSVSYTIFQTVTLNNEKSVVTGYIYDPSNTTYPSSQYCYVDNRITDRKSDTYQVAEKESTYQINWYSDLPTDVFQLAQNNCMFQN
jgi:hypothetical protein